MCSLVWHSVCAHVGLVLDFFFFGGETPKMAFNRKLS